MSPERVARQVATAGRVFGVIDDPRDAAAVLAALKQAGARTRDLTLLRGEEGAARIDALGTRSGVRARIRQLLSFTMADQMPDFALYEAAVADGRAVVAIRVQSDEEKHRARNILREHGGHFINAYGRLMTEELDMWRGPELDIPGLLRR